MSILAENPVALVSRPDLLSPDARLHVAELGGWPALQAKHFADGGVFDQLYVKR